MFTSVKYMPVTMASCIFLTMPIWIALFARLFLNEKLQRIDIISIFSAFIGMFLINNPFADNEVPTTVDSVVEDGFKDLKIYSLKEKMIGSTFALIGAIGGSLALLCMRVMKEDIHYSIAPFWFSIGCTFCAPIGAAPYMSSAEVTTTYDWRLIGLIMLASVGSFFGQIFQSRAY